MKQKSISFLTASLLVAAFACQEPIFGREDKSLIPSPSPKQDTSSYEHSSYPEVREAFTKYQEGTACFLHVLDIEARCITNQLEQCPDSKNKDYPTLLLRHLESNFLLQLEVVKRRQELGIEQSKTIEEIRAQMHSTLSTLKMRFL